MSRTRGEERRHPRLHRWTGGQSQGAAIWHPGAAACRFGIAAAGADEILRCEKDQGRSDANAAAERSTKGTRAGWDASYARQDRVDNRGRAEIAARIGKPSAPPRTEDVLQKYTEPIDEANGPIPKCVRCVCRDTL